MGDDRDRHPVVSRFATDADLTRRDKKVARASAWVSGRRILIEQFEDVVEAGWLHEKTPIAAQVAATLAAFTMRELQPQSFSVRDADAFGNQGGSRRGEGAGVAD